MTGRGESGVADLREVLFEFSAVGNSVKVCAVDPKTLVEATIFGPVTAGEEALKHAAVQKLQYVLAKKRAEGSSPTGQRFA